jgi:uncharacterized protein DUF4258
MKRKSPKRPAQIHQLPLKPEWAMRRIRSLAAKSENILFSGHALSRMEEREIFDGDVQKILRLGSVEGDVVRARRGEWKCKVVGKLRGSREAGVVVVILPTDKLFVMTAEWEDLS